MKLAPTRVVMGAAGILVLANVGLLGAIYLKQNSPPIMQAPSSHQQQRSDTHTAQLADDTHQLRVLADQAEAARQAREAKEWSWIACKKFDDSLEALISGDDGCGDEPYPAEETPEQQEKIAHITAHRATMNGVIGGCMYQIDHATTFDDLMKSIKAQAANDREQMGVIERKRVADIKACVESRAGNN